MWGQWTIAVLQQLPMILQFAETLVPGPKKGSEKKITAATEMVKYEGALAIDQRVKDAKSLLIDAQVAYINAMTAAAADAQVLGIPINPAIDGRPSQASAQGQATAVSLPSL